MHTLPMPTTFDEQVIAPNESVLIWEPCFPGYGTTLGNALRRVLLSSLTGAAATAVQIESVDHEFATIPGIKEDVVDILLNLKNLRFSLDSDEPTQCSLEIKGDKVITGADLKMPTGLVCVNPEQVIATMTDKKAELNMVLTVERGRGYVPVEMRAKETRPIGTLALDAVFSPVLHVGLEVENTRVGQNTTYEKLKLNVRTDGSISPKEAVSTSTKILLEQFDYIFESITGEKPVDTE